MQREARTNNNAHVGTKGNATGYSDAGWPATPADCWSGRATHGRSYHDVLQELGRQAFQKILETIDGALQAQEKDISGRGQRTGSPCQSFETIP